MLDTEGSEVHISQIDKPLKAEVGGQVHGMRYDAWG